MLRLGPKKIDDSPFRFIDLKYLEKKEKDKKIQEKIKKLTIINQQKRGDANKTKTNKRKKQRMLVIPCRSTN